MSKEGLSFSHLYAIAREEESLHFCDALTIKPYCMKRNYLIAALSFAAILFFSACSKEPHNPVDRDFTNSGFKKIDAGDISRLTISPGTVFSIHARGEKRDIDDLVLQNTGDTLRIRFNQYKPNRKIVYFTITQPSFEGINLSGQSEAIVGGFSETNPVRLTVSGQSACWINIEAPIFLTEASGQSKIEFQGGHATGLEADASGQSSIFAYGLMPVVMARVTATGQSIIKVKVGNNLRATASGQSRIYYQGTPLLSTISETGQAKVIQE